jgi:glycosyltransferase involved in cell wall biosynthesis
VLSGQPIAVVIPAFHESARIGRTVRSVPSFVDGIWVVDDASNDGTAEAALAVGEPRVRVVRHARNRGVGAAISTGYRAARADGAFAVAVMAGDAQMDPADLPALLAPLLAGEADYVKGNRLRHPGVADMPLARRAGTAVLGALTARAIGLPGLGDSQCGYTAILGGLIDRLPLELLYPRYGYPNDLLARVAAAGGRICEVTVKPVYAGEASGLRAWHVGVILGLLARARLSRASAPRRS